MKLFCVPFAGGSATIYQHWNKCLHTEIELIPVELSGRGSRLNEPFYENIDIAVSDIVKCIIAYGLDEEYAIFGHSMGGMLTYNSTLLLESLSYVSSNTHIDDQQLQTAVNTNPLAGMVNRRQQG